MEEQKIKQDICLGENVRMIRKQHGLKQTESVSLLRWESVSMTREVLVKIERGVQHIQASQLRTIKNTLGTSYEELLECSEP